MNRFVLGRWTVEPSLNEITCNGQAIALEPKVMRLLVRLAAGRGTVVTREQLIEDVWDGVNVVDGAIGRAVYQLRKALVSDGGNENYIQTVRQVGYRLTVEVRTLAAVAPPRREPFAHEAFRMRDLAFVFCAAVLVGGVAFEEAARFVERPWEGMLASEQIEVSPPGRQTSIVPSDQMTRQRPQRRNVVQQAEANHEAPVSSLELAVEVRRRALEQEVAARRALLNAQVEERRALLERAVAERSAMSSPASTSSHMPKSDAPQPV